LLERHRLLRLLDHHEIAVAPCYFVQVIFSELAPHSRYIAGAEAPQGHIWIRADIRSGRRQEQKSGLLTRIVDAVSKIGSTSRIYPDEA
jgi:hypothetical protein